MALNTATSVVDFMKSRGLASDFPTRKTLFEKAGLTPQQGEFRGYGGENTALLNYLSSAEKKAGVSITPDNLNQVLSASTVSQKPAVLPPTIPQTTPQTTQIPTGTSAVPISGIGPFASGEKYANSLAQEDIQRQIAEKSAQLQRAQEAGFIPGTETGNLEIPQEILTPPSQNLPTQDTQIPQDVQDRINAILKTPSAEELANKALEQVQSGATFPLQQEASQAEKDALKLQQQSETEKFIQQMAAKGLTFSGIREKGVSTIEADTLSKMLGVDRKFALLIAQGLESAAQSIAKEAQKGSQDALQSLRALGYDINPLTKRVEPTLAARQAEATQQRFGVQEARLQENARVQQERFDAQQSLREAQFTASQAKTTEQLRQANIKIHQAEERIRQAEERLKLQTSTGSMNYGAFNLPAPVK